MLHMRQFLIVILLTSVLLLPGPTAAQTDVPANDPTAVMTAIFDALMTGDVDAALAYVAEDAVLTLSPPPPDVSPSLIGQEAIRTWWETFASWNPDVEIIDMTVQGDMVMMTSYVTEDGFRALGVAPMHSELVGIVQDGLLKAYTVTFTKESQAKLSAALTLEANKAVVRRFYDELWNQGDLSVADEIISPDFEDGFSGQVGIEALKDTVQMFRTAFPEMQITYEAMVAEGDVVVVTITNDMGPYQGGLPEFFGIPDSAIGTEVVLRGIDYGRLEDGKMVAGWGMHDDLGWLQQFGLALVPLGE